ncbi:MAG: transketolase [Calditrichaceae bacterium]|nr:transketolase [Calditrichaceae bacterium]
MASPKTQAARKVLPPLSENEIKQLALAANTVRGLAMDGVQKANSGHPGMPLGMADAAAVLWFRHLKFNPENPQWPDRDRFVLSAGHGSMLLYSLLHLSGYDLPLSELQSFRQWESRTPGHPEYGLTPGVETTTGPLGQGISNAVGMALAERWLANRYNRPGFEPVNHFTYVIASDGDLMEGVSHESCSLAGHLRLGKLIVLYDDNRISIDGPTQLAFSENVAARFEAYGWQVQQVNGHDLAEVDAAIQAARAETARPSLIACRTVIGYGSPNRAGTAKAHGEPLGVEEVRLAKQQLGWPVEPLFYIPKEMSFFTEQCRKNGKTWQSGWEQGVQAYQEAFPELSAEFTRVIRNELPSGWDANLTDAAPDAPQATRAASGAVLNLLSARIPQLLGGSGDLTPSNNTFPKNEKHITAEDFSGRYIHFGVREHGMAAMMSGMALHGGIIPYGGTFLVFSDYMRPSIRLAALMKLPVIYVFTHDSVGLGEDGPTHQPVEQLTALRAIPNLAVIRPADAPETALAWQIALQRREGPTALILTRQKLPALDRAKEGYAPPSGALKGAYVLADASDPRAILIASGSEVPLALEAKKLLSAQGVAARVVSMPCGEIFDVQPGEYKESVLPRRIKARAAVEAGATLGWHKYVGKNGEIVGFDHFGASAPYEEIYKGFGVTPEKIAEAALRSLKRAIEDK